MSFQKIVMTIATVVLIVMLVVIGMALSKASYGETWPPIVGDCPDYWVDMSGNGEKCVNTHNLGTCTTESVNFNQAPFTGDTGMCAKYNWANTCKVTWDGITSGVKNPCDTSTTEEVETTTV